MGVLPVRLPVPPCLQGTVCPVHVRPFLARHLLHQARAALLHRRRLAHPVLPASRRRSPGYDGLAGRVLGRMQAHYRSMGIPARGAAGIHHSLARSAAGRACRRLRVYLALRVGTADPKQGPAVRHGRAAGRAAGPYGSQPRRRHQRREAKPGAGVRLPHPFQGRFRPLGRRRGNGAPESPPEPRGSLLLQSLAGPRRETSRRPAQSLPAHLARAVHPRETRCRMFQTDGQHRRPVSGGRLCPGPAFRDAGNDLLPAAALRGDDQVAGRHRLRQRRLRHGAQISHDAFQNGALPEMGEGRTASARGRGRPAHRPERLPRHPRPAQQLPHRPGQHRRHRFRRKDGD